ncbi:MAG: polysaccharide biosynthesis/export family protein [Bacteroidales bacterium]|nr:polysaccharide biosynthesis/export family protein [Bacteroidales bacterium]
MDMKITRLFRTVIVLSLAAVTAASCVTNRKVAYLQDMKNNTQIMLENKFEAVISPYDELDVFITCFDTELAKPFNIRNTEQSNYSTQNTLAYLVDQNGDIELPVLGSIHAAGLARLQLQEKIKNMLVAGSYLSDPYVMVRFRDFKIFFLGSNGGKAITVPNERCTFLEALALSGDLNVYTNRKKIAVMREVNGRMVMRYLDPRSSRVFRDPYFMLQQNDFIITQDTGYRNFMLSYTQWSPFLSLFSTAVSVAATYFAAMTYMNTK